MSKHVIYEVAQNGDLLWTRHVGYHDGIFKWDGPNKVGNGWSDFTHLLSGDDGIVYGVTAGLADGGHAPPGGDLMWMRHLGREDGTFRWDGPKRVGTGWSKFTHLFPGGDGLIYGVTAVVEAAINPIDRTKDTPRSGGDLIWMRHVGRDDGSFRWEGPKTVGTGWHDFTHLFAGDDGIIYGVTSAGDLMWMRHLGRDDGTFSWDGPRKVGTGWGKFSRLVPGEDGIIYGVTEVVEATIDPLDRTKDRPRSGGDLIWMRHIGHHDGSFRWEGPKTVGTGWMAAKQLFSGGSELSAEYNVAARSMQKFHRGTGSAVGPLGDARDAPRRASGGRYVQDFQLGVLTLDNFDGVVQGEVMYEADVTLAAVQCFGTQDRNVDQTYVVMSLVTVDPNNPGGRVQTQRTMILDGVRQGNTIFKNAIQMKQPISGTSGLMVHLAVWDHESGDADRLRDDINNVLQDGATKAASALAGGDLAGQGGFIGDIMNFEVGGIKPFKILTLGVSGLIAGLLADDLIGEHVYVIPPGNIVDFADQGNFTKSIRPTGGALDFDVQFNWPPRPENEFVFTDGRGTYKIYLRIAGVKVSIPIVPTIKVP